MLDNDLVDYLDLADYLAIAERSLDIPAETLLRGTRTGIAGLTLLGMTTCPNCGHENEAGAKFCSQCAAPLAERRSAGATERKLRLSIWNKEPKAAEAAAVNSRRRKKPR